MALSKFILDISRKIEDRSGAKINLSQGTTGASEKWIAEREISKMKSIHLRTAEETKNGSVMKLQQFNPSALLENDEKIRCRIPGCSSTTHGIKSSEEIKQDLFLCDTHHAKLTSALSKRCAQENVIVKDGNLKHEDFNGYTYLIDQLESAFRNILEAQSSEDILLAEIFLNTRNFLFLTKALLNPDKDNTTTALEAVLSLLKEFLADPKALVKRAAAIRDVIMMVLTFFGVDYSWVVPQPNPGARVGAGTGLVFGFVGALACTFPPAGILASSLVGLVAGNLIGSGGYDIINESGLMRMLRHVALGYLEYANGMLWRVKPSQHNLIYTFSNANGELTIVPNKRN